MKRLTLASGFVVLVLAMIGLRGADAATLPLNAGRLAAFTISDRCATAALPVTPGTVVAGKSTQVVVAEIPPACLGRPVTLRPFAAAGALTAADVTATLPTAGTRATLSVPSYTVTQVSGVAMTASTWGLATRWTTGAPGLTCTIPANPSVTCTVTGTDGSESFIGWTYNRSFRVTTSSTTPVAWQVTIDLSDTTQFPFVARSLDDASNSLDLVSATSCSTSPRTVTVRGTVNGAGDNLISVTDPEEFRITGRAYWTNADLIACF
ncbi:hypothetical protein AB6N24_17810 [Cellulomonas sp. 179-A 4D5 NHS]|uniref:hypothetical protein n=1 Tax=Cellulomonas sp. 179-A 4D5 NHS TaxID=3142378 RepID=UPI0039A1470A